MNNFQSNLRCLADLKQNRYVIPSYQRPYVWKEEQIEKLLHNIQSAFKADLPKYYIGTIVTCDKNGIYELIDGQQRFTTLWLIAYVFHKNKHESKLIQFLKYEDELRIDFAIRTQVTNFLGELLNASFSKDIERDIYTKDIATAIVVIETFIRENGSQIIQLGDFIYEKVLFIKNVTPKNADLNKLFTTLNNNGVQLEQTDILKAGLLSKLKSEKILYSKIWEACEPMDNYFEANVLAVFNETERKSLELWHFWVKNISEIFKYKTQGDTLLTNSIMSLKQIIACDKASTLTSGVKKEQENRCRSIISFSQLLLHTYRIFLHKGEHDDFQERFSSDCLLKVFQNFKDTGTEEDIKSFFLLLWKVRYVFDKFIIKWRKNTNADDDSEDVSDILTLTEVYKDKDKDGNFYRTNTSKSYQSMLQSVLYFTANRNTQIWLTPYLYRLYQLTRISVNKSKERETRYLSLIKDDLKILENIDNKLSLGKEDDKFVTWQLMTELIDIEDIIDYKEYLNKSHGTHFHRYWFFKLEYVLWKNWEQSDEKVKDYRITSKNSIEHVFPQRHEFKVKLTDSENDIDWLNCFGNLGLLSVGQNSSYSNQDVQKKKVDFDRKPTYDSLKLAKIYASDCSNWDIENIKEHQDEMIKLLVEHYNETTGQ